MLQQSLQVFSCETILALLLVNRGGLVGILQKQAMSRRRHVNDQLVYWEARPVLITMERLQRLFDIVKHFDADAVIESGDNLVRNRDTLYECDANAIRLSIHGHIAGIHLFLGHHFTLITTASKDDKQHAAINRLRLELNSAVRPIANGVIRIAPFAFLATAAAVFGVLSAGFTDTRLVISAFVSFPAVFIAVYAVMVGVFGRVRIRLYGSSSWWSMHGGQLLLNVAISVCSIAGTLVATLISGK